MLRTVRFVRIPEGDVLDDALRDALRDRAQRDSIRSIHLVGRSTDLLDSVISSLILDGEDVRDSSIESLKVEYINSDISKFLARYRFPKLRELRLVSLVIPSWDYLKLPATHLTTLSLEHVYSSSGPTASQLPSILASYPNLQDFSHRQDSRMIPHGFGDGPTFRAPLRCLKRLYLSGSWCRVFQLLQQLECPDKLDSTGEKASELLGPYLQDRIQRDDRFRADWGPRFHAGSLPSHSILAPLANSTFQPCGRGMVTLLYRCQQDLPTGFLRARARNCSPASLHSHPESVW